MSEENNGLNDAICMEFLKSREDLSLKEGEENRLHNALVLDKTDLAIAAIDFTIKYMKNLK